MSAKLNQIIALEKGIKNSVKQELTNLHQLVQKNELLHGFNKTYRPLNTETGEKFPPEAKKVQVRATEVIKQVKKSMSKLFDITATKELSNTVAKANIVVDEVIILSDVPVTYLLFLEKQLVDIRTFISKLPILDSAEEWKWMDQQNLFSTDPIQSIKTKKVEKIVVKYDATKEHPAQTEIRPEDVTIGHWDTLKYSGALKATEVRDFMSRVEALQEAVKIAREEANSAQVLEFKAGEKMFDFIFG